MISAWILWREAFGFVIARRPEADVAISQDPAGLQEGLGEYGNFTRRGVEDAAPYKACALGGRARKFATANGAH